MAFGQGPKDPLAAFNAVKDSGRQAQSGGKKKPRKAVFALMAVGALVFSMLWNPPTGSVHSFTEASDYNSKKESGCVNSGKGCHGKESAYTDFNAYHPNSKCSTCHEYTGVGCIPCHAPAEHECALCHDGTMEVAGDRVRLTDPYPRGHYRETTHTAMGTDMDVPVRAAAGGKAQATCVKCHKRDLRKAHTKVTPAKDSRYGETVGCGECHNDRKSFGQAQVLADWKDRSCEVCHSEKSATPMHAVEGPKVVAKDDEGCGESGSGCHQGGDLHGLHPDNPVDCSGSAVDGEPGCHDLSIESHVPTATACAGGDETACHRNYVGDDYGHAHDKEVHSPETRGPASDTSYYSTACGDCHLMEPDGTSLVDEHARSTSALSNDPNNCTNCHMAEASAEAIAKNWPDRNTAAGCDDCHGTAGLQAEHSANAPALHVSDSVGCGSTGPGCHPTSNLFEVGTPTIVRNLHTDCVRCHDATPSGGNVGYQPGSTTCGDGRSCHGSGYSLSTSVHDGGTGLTDGRDALHTASSQNAKALLVDAASGISTTCSSCHQAALGAEHERVNNAIATAAPNTCRACHSANETTARTVKRDGEWRGRKDACGACHGAAISKQHGDTAVAHEATQLDTRGVVSTGTCVMSQCHETADLRVLHKGGCTTSGCHTSQGDIFGLGIVSCGGKNPERSCHVGVHSATGGSDPENHLAGVEQKNATYTDATSTLSPTCGTCHQMFLGIEHRRPNSRIAADVPPGSTLCSRCHERDANTLWVSSNEWPTRNTLEACAACHGKDTVPVLHGGIDTAHAARELSTSGVVTPGYCAKSGCHPTTDVRRLHRFVGGCTTSSTAGPACHRVTGDIRGSNIRSCGGNDAARSCHTGFSEKVHMHDGKLVDHRVLISGTVNGVTYGPTENGGCAPGCHRTDLSDEHSPALVAGSMDGGGASGCRVCHLNTDDPGSGAFSGLTGVKSAIANADHRCVACHASGSATDGPAYVASPHKAVSTNTTRPAGSVWADPKDQWRAAYEGVTGGGHNAVWAASPQWAAKRFPGTAYVIGGAPYQWALAPNVGSVMWLKDRRWWGVATATVQVPGLPPLPYDVFSSSSVTTTEAIQGMTVTCDDCHAGTDAAVGPQGAAVKVTIDPDYSQTEYSNPTTGTYQFDPFNLDAANRPGQHAPTPLHRPVICYKCHTLFAGTIPGNNTAVGGHPLHRVHRARVFGTGADAVYRSGYCIDCHVRIPHAWRRPRLLVRTIATTDGAPVDTAPYVRPGGSGLEAMRLVDFPDPTSVSRDNCVTGGCYSGSATASNHPLPSQVGTNQAYWP